jgi:aspartate/methionine/tyrosine aminotransferase
MTTYDQFLSRAAERMKESAIRKMGTVLAGQRDIISFAPGYPAPETFAWAEFRDIAATLLSGTDGHVLQYGPTRGYRPLLDAVQGILSARGITSALEDLLVTTGSQQGLDLVARVLLDPGDVVLVELPTYTGAITAFRNVQAEMVGVPQEKDGVDLAALDATCEAQRRQGRTVKMLYVVPNFQNPTGLLIGLKKRQLLLEWAERRDILIVEDDPYRELFFEDSASEADVRPIKADDRDARVIYLSSFSKTLAPGFRVAWIAAPPHGLARPAVHLRGVPSRRARSPAAGAAQALPAQARRHGTLDPPRVRGHGELARTEGRLLPVADAPAGDRRRSHDRARRPARRDLRRGRGVLRERPSAGSGRPERVGSPRVEGRHRREHDAAVVLGADTGAHRAGRLAAARRRARRARVGRGLARLGRDRAVSGRRAGPSSRAAPSTARVADRRRS